jgi:hypothetical protein
VDITGAILFILKRKYSDIEKQGIMLCFFVFQKEGGTEKMKITIQNGELEQKVGIALKGVNGRNSTKPILKCIIIKAKEDEILLEATNLEIGLRVKVDGTVEEEGCCAIDGKSLADISRKMPEGDVVIQSDEKTAVISGKKVKIKLPVSDVESFPGLPDLTEMEVSCSVLQGALKDVNLADQAAFEAGLSEHAVSGPAGENAKAYGALHGADGAIHPAEFSKTESGWEATVRHTLRYKTPQLQSELTGQISMQELQNHSRRHSLKAVEQTRHWQMRQGYAPLAWRQCRKTRASRCIPSETGKCMASMRIKRARYILLAEPG